MEDQEISLLVKEYQSLRNGFLQSEIKRAWLDIDHYGYKGVYETNSSKENSVNWSYLNTFDMSEALDKMRKAIAKYYNDRQVYHPFQVISND
jgi:hypothetical protein